MQLCCALLFIETTQKSLQNISCPINVINDLACVYCYFLRAELNGDKKKRSNIGQLLTAAGPQ